MIVQEQNLRPFWRIKIGPETHRLVIFQTVPFWVPDVDPDNLGNLAIRERKTLGWKWFQYWNRRAWTGKVHLFAFNTFQHDLAFIWNVYTFSAFSHHVKWASITSSYPMSWLKFHPIDPSLYGAFFISCTPCPPSMKCLLSWHQACHRPCKARQLAENQNTFEAIQGGFKPRLFLQSQPVGVNVGSVLSDSCATCVLLGGFNPS